MVVKAAKNNDRITIATFNFDTILSDVLRIVKG